MKFCKKYEEYMRGQKKKLPGIDIKKLKKIMKRCSRHHQYRKDLNEEEEALDAPRCSDQCPVCDGSFFPSLLSGTTEVVGCFNEHAQKLLEQHRASGFTKYFLSFKGKLRGEHIDPIQEGMDLVSYALINSVAVRKILKKYDKIHYSKQGQLFMSRAQSMHKEVLWSPWLLEFMAFHINLRETKNDTIMKKKAPAFFDGFSLTFKDNKPSLTCESFDSIKLDIGLTCSICLDTVFDPVCLTCGHIFCYMCACSSASVNIVDGLKAVNSKAKCPLCRVEGVYQGAIHLEKLNILLGRSCREYWEQRRQIERTERLKQIKKYWELQCRAFMGV